MNITKTDCSSFTIQSTLIAAYVNSQSSTNPVVDFKVKIKINCCVEKILTYSLSQVSTGIITIVPNLVTTETDFEDGVYSVVIESKYTNGSIKKDKACIFINCKTKCKVVNYSIAKKSNEAYILYERLVLAESCLDCDCEQSCLLFNQLVKLIGEFTTYSEAVEDTIIYNECACKKPSCFTCNPIIVTPCPTC